MVPPRPAGRDLHSRPCALFRRAVYLTAVGVDLPSDRSRRPERQCQPPIARYRKKYGWGGTREGAGKKARRQDGRKRVRLSVSVDPDICDAVVQARQEGESVSNTVERLLRDAVARTPIQASR